MNKLFGSFSKDSQWIPPNTPKNESLFKSHLNKILKGVLCKCIVVEIVFLLMNGQWIL